MWAASRSASSTAGAELAVAGAPNHDSVLRAEGDGNRCGECRPERAFVAPRGTASRARHRDQDLELLALLRIAERAPFGARPSDLTGEFVTLQGDSEAQLAAAVSHHVREGVDLLIVVGETATMGENDLAPQRCAEPAES
jgi:hypothetical protein